MVSNERADAALRLISSTDRPKCIKKIYSFGELLREYLGGVAA
jgi:hypothetical protein